MITAVPGLTDRAYDALLGIYERDRVLWAAAYAISQLSLEFDGRTLRALAQAHGIDPDQE